LPIQCHWRQRVPEPWAGERIAGQAEHSPTYGWSSELAGVEVKSGELIAPGIPAIAEHALMEDLVTTCGKTWHCWQIDRDPNFPFGIPQLMMGFTKDGQIDQQLIRNRDRRFDVSSDQRQNDRADIEMPTVLAGANSWQSGRVLQLKAEEVPVRNIRPGQRLTPGGSVGIRMCLSAKCRPEEHRRGDAPPDRIISSCGTPAEAELAWIARDTCARKSQWSMLSSPLIRVPPATRIWC
jgi:hypothetical protein